MTHTTPELTVAQLQQLTRPLNEKRIANRKQGGRQLSYLEAWDVKATLIRIFGFGGFSAEALECEIVSIEDNVPRVEWKGTYPNKEKVELPIEFTPDGQKKFGTYNFRVTARVRVKLYIKQLDATYTEWAASSQTGPDLGEVTDFAIKTAESDALKRAAIYLGTQFGLSLYDDGSLNDVVGTILAPGQEWARGDVRPPSASHADVVQQRLEAMAKQRETGEHPPASSRVLPPGNGITPEQHADNLALVDRAMGMKAAQEEQDPAGEEYQQHVTADRNAPEPDEVAAANAVADTINQ